MLIRACYRGMQQSALSCVVLSRVAPLPVSDLSTFLPSPTSSPVGYSKDLNVTSRALVLDALQQMKLSAHRKRLVDHTRMSFVYLLCYVVLCFEDLCLRGVPQISA